MMYYDHGRNIQDIDSAVDLARAVVMSLEEAESSLSSARNWGIYDMLGGGFISGMIKHSKINRANDELVYTKTLIHQLQNQISEIHFTEDLYIDIGDFAVFADYFFDGLIADWYVQSKIKENKEKVQRVKYQMQEVLRNLQNLRKYEQSQIN